MTYRINPSAITGSPADTGISNAVGPYHFRGGPSCQGVRISGTSSNTTDVFSIGFTEPGVALATNSNEVPAVGNLGSNSFTGPFSIVLDTNQMGGNVDVYVWTTTQTGTPAIKIERVTQ